MPFQTHPTPRRGTVDDGPHFVRVATEHFRLNDALTADHHSAQAGLKPLPSNR
jgi:hypothetical protein